MTTNWIVAISAALTTIATVVLAIITGRYVKLTREVVREMNGQRQEMEIQRLAAALPVVSGQWQSVPGSSGKADWRTTILNQGTGIALNVLVQLKTEKGWAGVTSSPVLAPGGCMAAGSELPENGVYEMQISCVDMYQRHFSSIHELRDPMAGIPVSYRLEQVGTQGESQPSGRR